MDFIRFYARVVREAFRHSLDFAQGAIFLVFIIAGAIATGNPGAKMMLDSLDLGGWKTAALAFGSIIAIRLILAPYWLWKGAQARSTTAPERSIDYKLTIPRLEGRIDPKKTGIQIVFVLHNSSYFHAVAYEVEEVYVEVDGKTVDQPNFLNKGETIPPTERYNFDYQWIFAGSKNWPKPGTTGHASITFKYGIAGQPFSRRKRFAAVFSVQKDRILHNPTENTEEAI